VVVVNLKFFVQGYLGIALRGTPLIDLQVAVVVVPVLLASGALLAAVSASVAIRRYLKV
jgi:cell division transport system permease protein